MLKYQYIENDSKELFISVMFKGLDIGHLVYFSVI